MSLIYLDSSILIYLIERHPIYASIIEKSLSRSIGSILATSALVRLEVLTKPMQDGQDEIVALYRQFLDSTRNLSINDASFSIALELRAKHRLKTPDALHLAVALIHHCDAFWTNDNRLAAAAAGLSVNLLGVSQ